MVHPTTDYLKPITFLVIDNKPYMRRLLKNVLETLGAKRIEEARDGGDGLAAVKSLVELHHGTLRVDSKPGQGSTFCVAPPPGPGVPEN